MPNFGSCETTTKHPRIVLKENQRKITFRNLKRKPVRKIVVDDCAIKEGKRCDFLVIGPDDREHFVELKGSHVAHAIEQIEVSIPRLSEDAAKHPKCSYVICAYCPLTQTAIQIHANRFMKRYCSELKVKGPKHEVAL